jgi:hypothetical protein
LGSSQQKRADFTNEIDGPSDHHYAWSAAGRRGGSRFAPIRADRSRFRERNGFNDRRRCASGNAYSFGRSQQIGHGRGASAVDGREDDFIEEGKEDLPHFGQRLVFQTTKDERGRRSAWLAQAELRTQSCAKGPRAARIVRNIKHHLQWGAPLSIFG